MVELSLQSDDACLKRGHEVANLLDDDFVSSEALLEFECLRKAQDAEREILPRSSAVHDWICMPDAFSVPLLKARRFMMKKITGVMMRT